MLNVRLKVTSVTAISSVGYSYRVELLTLKQLTNVLINETTKETGDKLLVPYLLHRKTNKNKRQRYIVISWVSLACVVVAFNKSVETSVH